MEECIELDMCPKYTNAPALWTLPLFFMEKQHLNNYFLNAQPDLLYIFILVHDPRATLARSFRSV